MGRLPGHLRVAVAEVRPHRYQKVKRPHRVRRVVVHPVDRPVLLARLDQALLSTMTP